MTFREDSNPLPPDGELKQEIKKPLSIEGQVAGELKKSSDIEEPVSEQKEEQITAEKKSSVKKASESETKEEEDIKEVEKQIPVKETGIEEQKVPIKENQTTDNESNKDTNLLIPVEKIKEGTITKEDENIFGLLERDEPELAYHLALSYENEEKKLLLPSWLLENLFLSLTMRTATAPIALRIISNMENFKSFFEESAEGFFKNQLLFASTLRPSLLAYSSGAGHILNEIYSGTKGEFLGIKRVIIEYMNNTGGILNFEMLSQISGETELKQNKEKFHENIREWLSRAQLAKYRNKPGHFYSITFNNWVKKGCWIIRIRQLS